ncbi:autotransporter-associated beta strand repeat-containing protein [Prosthecobacter sp.]|uniref:autotransporter-associated beta strand repeat-containing protein n=1 Tax=Prosthecobacter sp. TaxID=1965333 RepID=UPI003782FB5B
MKASQPLLRAPASYSVMVLAMMTCQFGALMRPAEAATLYWDTDASTTGNNVNGTGLGGTGVWDLASANWWDGTTLILWPNTNGDTAIFSAPASSVPVLNTVTVSSGITANQLAFLRSGYVLTGGSLTLAGITPSLRVSFAELATIDSQVQGSDGLTLVGGGTLRLTNAANSYTGTTSISNGVLSISSNGALGTDTSAILVTGSTTRGFGGGALMLAGGYGSGVTLTRDVALQGLGPVPAFGAALLSVGDNTMTGTLTNGSGTLNTGIQSAGGRLTLTDVNLAGTTGTIFLTVGVGSSLANLPGSGSYAITGALSGSGSIQKSGGGTLIVDPTSAAGYSGTFRIYSGSMRFESAAAFGSNAGTGTLSTLDLAGDGAVLELRMDSGVIGKNVYNRGGGSPIIFVDHSIGSAAINGASSFGTLTYDDSETLTFNSRNGYGLSFGATPVITGDGATIFTNNLTGMLTFTGDFWSDANNSGNRTFTIGGNGSTTIDGSIIATASNFGHSIVKSGTGTLTITGSASTYGGNTTVSGGVISIANVGGINGSSPTGSVILGATTTTGGLQYTGTADTLAKPFSLAGTTAGGAVLADGTGALTLTGNVSASGAGVKTFFLGGASTEANTFSGLLLDNNSVNTTGLMKTGSGTWVLKESAAGSTGSASTVTISAPGTTATNIVTLSSGTTAGLLVGQTTSLLATLPQITGILDAKHFTISSTITTSTAPAGTYNVNAIPTTSTTTMGGTWSGPLSVANGLLQLQATNAASNIVPDVNAVAFSVDAYAGSQAAGGTLQLIGIDGQAVTETAGALLASAGAGTVRVTAGIGGTASLTLASIGTSQVTTAASSASTTVTVGSTAGLVPGMRLNGGSAAATITSITNGTQFVVSAAQTISASTTLTFDRANGGATVNFDPAANSAVIIAAVPATGLLNSYSYFNGADFAYASGTSNVTLRAPMYGADAGFLTVGAGANVMTTGNNYELTGDVTGQAATVISSLKLKGDVSLALTGLLTIRTGAAGTSGGLLATGGASTISGTGITTGGAADLIIRVDGASDVLTLTAPVTATTTGGLTKTGAGTLVIGGVNAYTTGGVTSLLEGTLQLAAGGRLSAASVNLVMRQGTTFDLNGVNTALTATTTMIGAFNGTGTVTNTSTNPVVFAVGGGTTGGTGTFSGSINETAGVISVVKMGTTNSQTWNGISNYTGSTSIGVPGTGTTGVLSVTTLANIGSDSSIGRGNAASVATNQGSLIFGGTTGGLTYVGTTSVSTDRLFTMAGTVATAGATITNNAVNNEALVFSNTNPIAFASANPQLLQLGGTSTSDNWFYPQITDSGSGANITSLNKLGASVWVLGNTNNTYTGTTTVSDGSLVAQDGQGLPSNSGLILGGTTTTGIFQSTGDFTRNLSASASAGANTVSWNTALTTGGGGFAASSDKLVVSIGGLATPTALTWNSGGFMGTAATTTGALVLNSITALGEVEFRNAIDLGSAVRTILVNDNTSTFTDFATITGAISGSGGISKTGSGLLQLFGANIYTGTTAVTAGQLVVNSLGSSTSPGASSVGDSSNANTQGSALTLGNAGTGAGILQYVGAGETSDRMIRLNTTTGSTQILADGSGPLILTNVLNDMAAGAKTLFLRGGSVEGNMITSVLANNGGNLGITADQGATWILSGDNTYSGTTNIVAGALGAGSDTAFGTGTIVLRNGALFAYGAPRTLTNTVSVNSTTTGGTSAFVGDYDLTMTGVWNYSNTTTGHTITNGMTAGSTLTLQNDMVLNALTGNVSLAINGTGNTTFNGNISTTTAFNVSISYTGDGTLTLGGVNPTAGTTTLNNNNGTLRLVGAGKLATGPLTVNAGTLSIESLDQSVGLLTMGNVANTNATVNVASGLTLSVTAITFAGTTTLPSTITGAGTLDLGSAGITVTVADNATQSADMVWTIAHLIGSGTFTKTGAGTLDLSGIASNDFSGSYQVNAGSISGLDALPNNLILNGGVYQGSGTFTRALGTGSNQVQFLSGGGGFAAVGGDLTVTFTGAPPPLVWGGTPSFLPSGATLLLGATGATGVTDFTHDIDLNNAARTISVVDNTAVTTDWAVLSGVLSNGGITKTGNGTLLLTGASSFTGAITLTAGTLQFSTVSSNGGGPSNLGQGIDGISLGGGRLQFIGSTSQTTDRAMTFTSTGILDASGTGGATITYTGAITAAGNSLNLEGSGEGFLNGKVTTTGTSADLNKNGTGTWTINVAPTIVDNFVITSGTVILNAADSFDGDDLFIREATLKLGVNGALTNTMDDLNISTETAGGGVLDINGTTGSSSTDIIIGTNPINQGTVAAFSGSLVDSVGGGSFSSGTLTLRSGLVSANLITTGAVTLGNVISNDAGGVNTTSGIISGSLTLNTGGSLSLISGTITGDITFAAANTTTKTSANTVTVSGSNTVTGGGLTTISAGVLVLDHGTHAGAKISDGALTMNGGTLQILGNASTAVTDPVGNLTLGTTSDPAPAVVKIDTAGAATTLGVGTITRAAGATLRFNPSTASGHLTTTATNTAGTILGGWATYQLGTGAAQFASVSGGEILGFSSTVMNDVTAWSAAADITDSTGFTGTLAGSLSINSLRFDAASGTSVVTIGASDVLDIASGGILITNSVGAGNPSISGGGITAGTLNELIVTQDGAAPFTLGSRMAASLALTKAGAGVMVLDQSNNTATGTVRIIGGTLRLQGGGALGDRAPVIMEAALGTLLDVVDSETIGTLSGGDTNNFRNMGVQIAAGKTLTINQLASGTFYGDISAASGAATFNKMGGSQLTITDGLINLGAGGVINVLAGRLGVDVNGSNQFVQSVAAGTTVNIGTGASFFIDHNSVTVATGVAGGRIGDDVVFNLNSTGSTTDGLFYRNDQNLGVTEVIGAVNFNSGVNSVRVDSSTTSANTSQNIILQAGSITRSNQATLVLRGIGIQATSAPRAQFQNASVMAGFGAGTGTSLPVIPWAIGPSAGGAAAADSFLTTAGTANAGWRPMNLATEYAQVTDTASWDATASTQNVLVSATTTAATGTTIRSLLISMGAGGAVDLTGTGVLDVDSGGFLFSGTGTSTIGGFTGIEVSPFTNEYVFHVVGGVATVSSALSTTTAALTKSGAGTLILSANNSGLGDVALNEGALQISDLDNIGGSTGRILFAGGTLRLDPSAYSGDDLSTRTFVLLSGGGTVDTNGNNISFDNAIGVGSTGGFTKAGAGVLTLNAQVGYTGSTTVSGGTLQYGIQDALPATMNIILAGGTLDSNIFDATLAGLSITANSTLNGNITVNGDVQVDGGGSRTLTVNNAGAATFSGGVVYLVNNGTSARTTTINGTGNLLISSDITNGTAAGALTYSGAGTLTLSGNNSYTGLTTMNNAAGTLVFSGASQISGTALTVNAGTVQLNPAFDQTIGNLIMGGGAAGSASNLLIGAGKTLTLTGTVTFSSTNNPLVATINGAGPGAILDFGGVARTFIIGDSTNAEPDMIIGANVTLQNDGGGGLIKQGTGTLHIAGINHLTGPITIQAGSVTGDLGSGNLLLNNGVYEGNGTFTRSLGAGGGQVQWVAGANGGFAASGGALTVTLAGAPDPLVWDSTPFFVSGTGTLLFGSTTADSVVTFTHNLDLNNTASPVTRTVTVNDNTDVTTDKAVLSGVLGSSGAAATLNKAGAGVLELSGANTFSALTLTAGTLQFSTVSNNGGGPSNLGQGTDGITLSGGILSFIGDGAASSQSTDRGITVTASTTLNASGTNGATITYAGAITAGGNQVQLTGAAGSSGFITGGIIQSSTSPDVLVSSGRWTISGTPIVVGDDFKINGTGTVLDLNTTGALSYVSGTSNFIYMGNGSTVNFNADDISSAALGLEGILVGFETTGAVTILNIKNFNITTPRLDVGQPGAALEGNIIGSGTINVTVTTSGSGLSLYRGSVSANLAGVGALLKGGMGDVILSGDNSGLTGAMLLSAGNLILDYTSSNTAKLNAATALDMRGGTLTLNGSASAATSQTVTGFVLSNSGSNQISVTGGAGQAAVLNLGAITRANNAQDGTVRFVLPSGTQSATNGITTSTLNGTSGMLGLSGFATVTDSTGTWFATNATNLAGGNIVALASTLENDVATWTLADHVTDGATGFTGTLAFANISSLRFNAAGGSDLNLASGGLLYITSGGILVTDSVTAGTPGIFGGTLASGVTELIVTQDSARTFEISSDIRINQALTKSGAGTLLLSGRNVYTGATEIQNGTLQVSGGNAIGDTSLVTLADDHFNMLQLLADETIGRLAGGSATDGLDDLATVDVGTYTLTFNQNAASTYSGLFTGTGTLVKNGALFDLTLNNASTGFSGTLRINGGGVIISGIGEIDASAIEINKGGYLRITNSGTTRSGTRIPDATTITLNSADGGIAGSLLPRGLYINTDQDTTLDETVGVVTLASGASYASLEATTTSDDSDIIMNNLLRTNRATLDVRGTNLGSTSSQNNQLRIGNSANQTAFIATLVGGGGAATTKTISIVPWAIGETVTGALAATTMGNSLVTYVSGAGFRPLDFSTEYDTFASAAATANVRESLAADLTGLAGKTINSLVIDNNATLTDVSFTGNGAGQALVNTSGAFLFTLNSTAAANTAYSTTLGGFDNGIAVGSSGEYVFFVVNPSSAITTATLSAIVSSSLTSAADITKSGRGTLVLTGTNAAGGGGKTTTINEGTLEISDLDNIGGNTGALVFAGGTLRLSSSYSGDDISSRGITFFTGGGTIDTNGMDLALGASVGSGAGGLTKTGLGNLTLNAAATYTGTTTISGGTLTVGADNATGIGGDLIIGAGATLKIGTFSISAGLVSTTGAGPFLQGTGTITASSGFAFGNTADIGVDAVLAGPGGLLKTQGNILTLSGLNTFSGPVEIQAGTLSFNSIANVGGGASALGSAATAQDAVIHMGLTTAATGLIYTGVGSSSDRTIGLQGTTGAVTLDASGTGALTLGVVRFETAGNKTLTLKGVSDPGLANTLGVLSENGLGVLTLVKSDTGTWVISATSNYSGATSINDGTLRFTADQTLGGALNFGSASSITTAGTLDLSGANASFGGALTVQTNTSAETNQILIGAGKTLAINGNVVIGTSAAGVTNTLFTASGDGSLVVTNLASAATFRVGGYTGGTAGAGNIASADFSGLASLQVSLNTTDGVFRVNNISGANTNGIFSVATLAPNTTITAATLAVGDGGQYNGSSGQVNQLLLGTATNTVNVNTVNIGTGSRDLGSVTFLNSNGTVTIRAADGSSAAAFNMGTGSSTTAAALPAGNRNTFDVTSHDADLLFSTFNIGTQNGRTGPMENLFAFDTGKLITGNLTMGSKTAAGNSTNVVNLGGGSVTIGSGTGTAATLGSNGNTGVVSASINVTGGTVTIGAGAGQALVLGSSNTNATGSTSTALNVSGGSVTLATAGSTAVTMASASLGTATAAINISGGSLTVQGAITGGTGAGTRNASVNLSGGTLDMTGKTIGDASNPITFNAQSGTLKNLGELNGGGAFDKTSNGTLYMDGVESYTGTTTVSTGTLQFVKETALYNNSASMWTAANLIVNSGATAAFNVGGAGEFTSADVDVIESLGTDTGGFKNGSSIGLDTTNAVGGSFTYGGVLADTNGGVNRVSFEKLGANTLVLSQTSTYTGTTTVSAGTLQVGDGSGGALAGAGAVTVSTGATLSGSGSIAGATTVRTGAFLAPGAGTPATSNQTLTFTSAGTAVDVQNGAQIQLGLSSSTQTDAGFDGSTSALAYLNTNGGITGAPYTTIWSKSGSYDSIRLTNGTFNLGSTVGGTILLSDNTSSIGYGSIFKLLDWSTVGTPDSLAGTGSFTLADLNLSGVALDLNLSWDTSAFTTYGVLVVVPEPSRALLLLMGLALCVFRRRRRHTTLK